MGRKPNTGIVSKQDFFFLSWALGGRTIQLFPGTFFHLRAATQGHLTLTAFPQGAEISDYFSNCLKYASQTLTCRAVSLLRGPTEASGPSRFILPVRLSSVLS